MKVDVESRLQITGQIANEQTTTDPGVSLNTLQGDAATQTYLGDNGTAKSGNRGGHIGSEEPSPTET